MIRVYFLPVETIDGTEQVAGIEWIHDALLYCTKQPDVWKLIMDTTDHEHAQLIELATFSTPASQEEIYYYHNQVIITPPDPDTIRAEEILATSLTVITQPQMWELIRIISRRLGYRT